MGKVSYSPADNKERTCRSISLLIREFPSYPDGYLKNASLRRIVSGRDLSFNSGYRAAVPDPYRHTMYLSVNGSYGESSLSYLIHVLHHEHHHLVESAVWKNMYFNWTEWNNLNPEVFSCHRI